MTQIERIQQILKDAGFYAFKVDGDFGRKSRTALNQADKETIKLVQTVLGFVGKDVDGSWGTLSEGRLQAAITGKEAKIDTTTIPIVASPPNASTLSIGADHWLVGAQRQPLPPKGSLTPLFVVNHNTEGATSESSIEAMQQRGVSAHVVIERDGKITQCVPFNQIAYHAGTSRWRHPKTGILYANSNDDSIGIEIANAGPESSALAWARRQPGFSSIRVAHRNGGPICEWEVHPPAQIVSVIALNQALVAKYTLADVTGHDFIAPERKSDCGPAFPMQAVREACGFSGLPATHHP